MKIEHKLQIDAVKGERIYYKQFGDLILISDGKIGVYLRESELKIDKNKMHEMGKCDLLDPDYLMEGSIELFETNVCRKTQHLGYLIKVKSKVENVHVFIQENYLKMFHGYSGIYFKTLKNPMLIKKYDKPYGIICPVQAHYEED